MFSSPRGDFIILTIKKVDVSGKPYKVLVPSRGFHYINKEMVNNGIAEDMFSSPRGDFIILTTKWN